MKECGKGVCVQSVRGAKRREQSWEAFQRKCKMSRGLEGWTGISLWISKVGWGGSFQVKETTSAKMWRQGEAEMSKADYLRVVRARACVRGEMILLFSIISWSCITLCWNKRYDGTLNDTISLTQGLNLLLVSSVWQVDSLPAEQLESKSHDLRLLTTSLLVPLNCDVGEDAWESLGLQGEQTSQS